MAIAILNTYRLDSLGKVNVNVVQSPDSGGYSGDQGWQWEVQATDQPVDEQRLRITELWEEKKSSFLIPDGYGGMMPDEDAVDQAVATELGINLDEVRTLLFFLEDYPDL